MVTRNLLLSTARVYLVIIAVKCCNILLMHCWQRLVVWLSGNAANALVQCSCPIPGLFSSGTVNRLRVGKPSQCINSPMSTQPGHPSMGMHSEYQ